MKTLQISLLGSAALLIGAQVLGGCSDDAKPQPSGGAGGGGGEPSSTSTNSSASTGASMGGGGSGGMGEMPLPACTKNADLTGKITADKTLTADTCYTLKGIVFVEPPATLTIEKGTKIMGEKVSLGTLVIEPGAKIMAEGTSVNPIVFTSQADPGDRAGGDWGGVIVLGKAPINTASGKANVEGITGAGTEYGGSDPNDSSGKIKYVRIEFSGVLLSPNNEINGLTLAGVGSGTEIDYVMVHETLDDCFEFFGGTVNAKHLVCANNGDDGFDWDFGYKGKLQFLALQQDPNVPDDCNGFEGDNDANSSANTPLSEPTIYNATLCGKNMDLAKQQYGMLLRRSTKGHLFNIVATGFEAGVDIRDPLTSVELKSSIFFNNLAANIAYAEVAGGTDVLSDDDSGFDEINWFTTAGNTTQDPQITSCFGMVPDFRPKMTITANAATPPDDGFFDKSASYIGAFSADSNWATGNWIDYSRN